MTKQTTLAIETSCDDTSIGIISFDGECFEVEKLLAYSQVSDHQKYGGVMPEMASRLHSEKIIEVLKNIGFDNIEKVDNISVTTHPGLPGSLVVGKTVGATLSEWFHKPLIQVNHIHGHIFSLFLERNINEFQFPMVVLTASGGHNDLYLINEYKRSSPNPSPFSVSSSPNPFSFREGEFKQLLHNVRKHKHIYGESGGFQTGFARDMRKEQTEAEEFLRAILRNRQFLKTKRRRQFPINKYIADFYCHEYKIIIELDGSIHELEEQKSKDKDKTENLESIGYKVLRYKNKEILQNPENILKALSREIPLSEGEGARGGGDKNKGDLEESLKKYTIQHLGKTLDDAAGECFDKVSRMLGGPYPGGPWISKMAKKHRKTILEYKGCNKTDTLDNTISFKRIFLSKEGFDFSFSGMKSQVSTLLKNLEKQNIPLTEDLICEIAYQFQEAVVEVLAKKLAKAGLKYEAKTLGISGGVSANDRLWDYANELIKHKNYINQNFSIFKPTKKVYSTDNAAMIGVAGIMKSLEILE